MTHYRWIGHKGLDLYDNTARMHDPLLARYHTVDPKWRDYPRQSPWSHCVANPINVIDPSGEDVTILNYTEGQHMAMLIQNEEGKWQYYSINGDKKYNSSSHSSGRPFNDVAVGSWDSPQEFLDSPYNVENNNGREDKSINNFGYQEGYIIKTTPEQDEIMRNTFVEKAQTSYGLLSNNCATVVQEVLESAGIPVSERVEETHSFSQLGLIDNSLEVSLRHLQKIIPTTVFNSIVISNPNGKLIRKQP